MLFTSAPFIVLLFFTIAAYYIVPQRYRWTVLLAASLFFYAYAGLNFLIYIAATIVSTYFCALKARAVYAIRDAETRKLQKDEKEARKSLRASAKRAARGWLLSGLIFNFGILAVIKYTNFIIGNVNAFLSPDARLGFMTIAVPLGISYYTFKSMSYLIDVYREKAEPQSNIAKLALFVCFFPQIIQGPISRYGELSKTLYSGAAFDWKNISYGLLRVMWGFFKTLVIANRLMPAADTLSGAEYQGVYVLINMLLYAVTLYANFTGGIDITIGAAEMMGVRMEENFDRPFYASNIADYWRRWHITMGSWFKDYLFYPMSVSKPMLNLSKKLREKFGGGLGKRAPVYIVTIVLWFMTGLWHGATWNFIVWGLVNGVVILISQELTPLYARFHKRFKFADTKYWAAFQILRTFLLMSAIRMFDRYDGVGTTFAMLGSVFTRFNLSGLLSADITKLGVSIPGYIGAGLGVCLMLLVSYVGRGGADAREKLFKLKWPLRYALTGALFFMTVVFGAYGVGYDAAQFIYNQF